MTENKNCKLRRRKGQMAITIAWPFQRRRAHEISEHEELALASDGCEGAIRCGELLCGATKGEG